MERCVLGGPRGSGSLVFVLKSDPTVRVGPDHDGGDVRRGEWDGVRTLAGVTTVWRVSRTGRQRRRLQIGARGRRGERKGGRKEGSKEEGREGRMGEEEKEDRRKGDRGEG